MADEEENKIKYMKHPVDMKEVKKWRAKGFEVIDERFDPDYKPPVKTVEVPPPGNPAGGGPLSI